MSSKLQQYADSFTCSTPISIIAISPEGYEYYGKHRGTKHPFHPGKGVHIAPGSQTEEKSHRFLSQQMCLTFTQAKSSHFGSLFCLFQRRIIWLPASCLIFRELWCFDFQNVHLRLTVWHSIKYVCDYHASQLTLLWTLSAPLGIIQARRLRNHFSRPWHSPRRRDVHQNVVEISSALESGGARLWHGETCPQV